MSSQINLARDIQWKLSYGHPRDAKKVPLTGAGHLQECKNTEFVWELRKTGLRGRPFVELFA